MLNPHYLQAKPESDSWVCGFEALDAKSQRSFDLCSFREHVLRPLLSIIAELDV
jgi:hypothetical protein